MGPLPRLPPPSPSKLQHAVRDYLVQALCVPPSRLREEVPSSCEAPDEGGTLGPLAHETAWEGRMAPLALLGYRVDILLLPRWEGEGGKPLALEVDGPHHFLVEEGA